MKPQTTKKTRTKGGARRLNGTKARTPLTEDRIRHMVDKMPLGISGFCKGWGWLNFARKIEAAHGIK